MLVVVYHMQKIGHAAAGQKRSLCLAALLLLTGCTGPALVESTPNAVTVRYDAMDGIDAATRLAQRACSAHSKSARLRTTVNFGLSDRYAHFDCI
ncbi:MAG: hypothetical protein WA633_28505 [Stellaceae bacterium]